jgi:sialic acid synthase SpsE
MKIVCEMAKDHGGSVHAAKEMIRDAAGQGVYAVKFQAYDLNDLNKKHTNYKRNKECHLTMEQLEELKDYADAQNVKFWCSVFSRSCIKPLSKFIKVVKVPSTFLSWDSFILDCLVHFPSVHISTGMHNRKFIKKCMSVYNPSVMFKKAIFYHCISEYPVTSGTKLDRIKDLGMKGFSYHGSDFAPICLAKVHGAEWLEVHYSAWMTRLKEIQKTLSFTNHLLYDDGKPSSEELKNLEFYKSEFKGLKKCLK